MAHRFQATYPDFKRFMFIYLGRDGVPNSPINNALATLTGRRPNGMYDFFNIMQRFYTYRATDADILVYDAEQNETDDTELADSVKMNTGLSTTDGAEIWLVGKRNQRPLSLFMGVRVERKEALFGEPEEAPTGDGLRARYPSFLNLAYVPAEALKSQLSSVGVNVAQIDARDVLAQVANTYQRLQESDLVMTCDEKKCEQVEQADHLILPTGYSDSDGEPVLLSLCKNRNPGRQPWTLDHVVSRLPANCHTLLSTYPVLLGFAPNCLVYMRGETANSFEAQMHGIVNGLPVYENCVNRVNQMYRNASDDDIELLDGDFNAVESVGLAQKLRFHTDMKDREGKLIDLVFERNIYSGAQPFSRFSIAREDELYPGVRPRDTITHWAYFADFAATIEELKRKAVQEVWTINGGKENDILDNYLRYTFAKALRKSGRARGSKIRTNRDGTVAVFNTGLVDVTMSEIYMVFVHRNGTPMGSKWAFAQLSTINDNDRYLNNAGFTADTLPGRLQFWRSTSDLVYPLLSDEPIDRQLPVYNREHIILDRLYRYPASFVLHCCFYLNPADRQVVEGALARLAPGMSESEQKECWSPVVEVVRRNPTVYNAIKDQIDSQIRMSIRRQMLDYKTIIPCYYPEKDCMNFLMPLELTNDPSERLALVLERDFNGTSFYGRTVLTMEMAYKNSRLICRPEVNWLRLDDIHHVADDED